MDPSERIWCAHDLSEECAALVEIHLGDVSMSVAGIGIDGDRCRTTIDSAAARAGDRDRRWQANLNSYGGGGRHVAAVIRRLRSQRVVAYRGSIPGERIRSG